MYVATYSTAYNTTCFYHHRGMGDAAGQVYKRLANLLTEKLDLSYGEVMGWIR